MFRTWHSLRLCVLRFQLLYFFYNHKLNNYLPHSMRYGQTSLGREMIQWIKCLPWVCENGSLDSQNPHEVWWITCIWILGHLWWGRRWWERIPWSLLDSLPGFLIHEEGIEPQNWGWKNVPCCYSKGSLTSPLLLFLGVWMWIMSALPPPWR